MAGSELSNHWNLPANITSAIRNHHDPLTREGADSLACIVHLADIVAHWLQIPSTGGPPEGISPAAAAHLGFKEGELEKYARQIAQSVEILEEDTF